MASARKPTSGGQKTAKTAAVDARYRAIVDTAVDAIVVIDERGRIEAFNPAAERLFGYKAVEMVGRNVHILMPEPYHGEHDGYLARYRETGERRIIGIGREVSGLRSDGTTFPLELSIAEWNDGDKRFFTGVMRDVTDRRRAEELQRLMINELNHRVKNTLVVVQSLARHSLREGDQNGLAQFNDRVYALASAHDLLTRRNWEGADLGELLAEALKPYASQVRLDGPPLPLAPNAALALAMIFHELATNASKYGALSIETGQVAISWSLGGHTLLTVEWRERGGPLVKPPERGGFGSRLIAASLKGDLAGSATFDYAPEGLTCVMSIIAPPQVSLAKGAA